MAGFGSWLPFDEVASMPTDNPLAKIVAGGLKSIATLPRRAIQAATVQPGLRREDITDIPGASQPVDPLVGASTEAGMNMIGTALPFASAGAVGAAGGKLAKPYHDLLESTRAGPSRLKLTPAEEKHFDEMMKPQYGIQDEVPSIIRNGNSLEWSPDHTGPLLNWIDESRYLRSAGEPRLPPSFYKGSELYKRMENVPSDFKIAPYGEHL